MHLLTSKRYFDRHGKIQLNTYMTVSNKMMPRFIKGDTADFSVHEVEDVGMLTEL